MSQSSARPEFIFCAGLLLCFGLGCGRAPLAPPTIAVPAQASAPSQESWEDPKVADTEECFGAWRAATAAREQLDRAGRITVPELVVHLRRQVVSIRSVEKAAADLRLYEDAIEALDQHERGIGLLIELGQEVSPDGVLSTDRDRPEPLEEPEEVVGEIVPEMEDLARALLNVSFSIASRVAEAHPDSSARSRASCLAARIEALTPTHEELVAVRGMIDDGEAIEGGRETALLRVREGLIGDPRTSFRAVEAALQGAERDLFHQDLIELWGSVRDRCAGGM